MVEAAHIKPYDGTGSNTMSNGILLIWNDLSNVSGYLIWNDLSNVSGYLRVTSDSGHGMTVTTERLLRRLITLIYAGRDRMVVIRRELPRTKRAGPACRPAA